MKSLDIRVGAARVPFAPATTTRDNTHFPAGYALPGGARTEDRFRALVVAANIDQIINGQLPIQTKEDTWESTQKS